MEFIHTGQDGYTESYDARFSIAYIATGTVSNVKPSIVTKCAFHKGFNSAVGAFGTGSLNISSNVVHGTVGNGRFFYFSSHDQSYRDHFSFVVCPSAPTFQTKFFSRSQVNQNFGKNNA